MYERVTIHALPGDEETSFGAFVEALLSGGFFLEFNDAFSNGFSTIVNDHDGTFDAAKVLLERVLQQFVGDIGREVLHFDDRTLAGEADAQRLPTQDVPVQVLFGLFSQLLGSLIEGSNDMRLRRAEERERLTNLTKPKPRDGLM